MCVLCILMVDINECLENNAGCDHTCVNTPGSYYCQCGDEHELQDDMHSCQGNYYYVCFSIFAMQLLFQLC